MHALPAPALGGALLVDGRDALSRSSRRALTAGVLLIHGAAAWSLLQGDGVRQVATQAAPVMMAWMVPVTPRPAPSPPPLPRVAPRPPLAKAAVPSPVLAVPEAAAPAPWRAPAVPAEAPAPAPALAPASAAPTLAAGSDTAPGPATPPAAPAAPKPLPSSAIHYLVPPAVVVPTASRRLNEQGTVWLRLVVDAQGMPQQVSVHQSSGFRRLDEQALQAMRAARFKPYTERGVALEWTAIAPLAYELE